MRIIDMKKLILTILILFTSVNISAKDANTDWFKGGKSWDGTYLFGSFFLQRYFSTFVFRNQYIASSGSVVFWAILKEGFADEYYKQYPEKFPSWWHNIGDKRGFDDRDVLISAIGAFILPAPIHIVKWNKNRKLIKLIFEL